MKALYRVEEIRAAERAAVAAGLSEAALMAAAGQGVAQAIVEARGGRAGTALFLVGPGNNGGDGLVAAAELVARGWRCLIWGYRRTDIAGAPVQTAAAEQFTWVESGDGLASAALEADVIVDAVFGIGSRADLPAEVAAAFAVGAQARLQRGTPLIALDVPSGVDADTGAVAEGALHADLTVMVGLPKIGLFRAPALRHTGVLRLVEIGLPEPDISQERPRLIKEDDVRDWLPRRPADTHKRAVGSLLVVGGAPTYYGAPRLAAAAAARAGAGLVTLAVSRSLIAPIATALPEVTFLPLPEGELGGAGARMARIVHEQLARYRALVVGPGLGQDATVDEFLGALFHVRPAVAAIGFGATLAPEAGNVFSGRAVLDADALNWLARQPEWVERLRAAELVLTPHPGELSRLLATEVEQIVAEPWESAREASQRFGHVVVLKLGHAVVASPDGTLLVAPQALPALASAGTGDVLAGTIGGLMAQGLPALAAAAAGVYLGCQAALLAMRRVGTLGLVASDVIDALPKAIAAHYDARWGEDEG
ncbi:MAG: NAD(P)H-hydrate dehydratase [Sphaerobacter sp.]|nr:NAD(P)H-hydrate dehydratase [Sphaerobacter sp.]